MNAPINPLAVAGHNQPPKSPYDEAKEQIEDLYDEAKGWLDGAPVDTEALATGVEKLEGMLKDAIREADAARTAEYKPLNEAKAEIQERYASLIGGSKCDGGIGGKALAACKAALLPWRTKVDEEKRARAEKARKEAGEKATAARAAQAAADAANLAEREAAAGLAEEAAKAERIAKAAATKAVTTKTGLRTVYVASIIDTTELARHVWKHDHDGLRVFLQSWADRAVRDAGKLAATMTIPGVDILEVKESR